MILIFLLFLVLSISTGAGIPENQNITALILARGGSKGIPLKNIEKVLGQSLLERSLKVLKDFGKFHEIWVSTDHPEISKEAEKFGALVHHRSAETSKDTTSSMESVQEFIKENPDIENLALIQCTSIFLKKKYLEVAFAKFPENDCVFSATKSFNLRWGFTGDVLGPLNFNSTNRPRRQDWDGEFIENGMFYFTRIQLINQGVFQNERCNVVAVDPEDSLEIDTPYDLKLAEFLLSNKN